MNWNPLDQLPVILQIWGAMLLGAVLLMAGLFVGIEWRWICYSARVARLRVGQALLRVFTSAGDGGADGCIDCNRWALNAGCLSCGRTRVLTATRTIATDGPTAASIAAAREINAIERARAGRDPNGHRLYSLEEHRRRQAFADYEDIDLDLDNTVAH